MASSDLGDLSFTMSVKSNVEQEINKIKKALGEAQTKAEGLEKQLKGSVSSNKAIQESLRGQFASAKGEVSQLSSSLKAVEGRYNQILNVTKDINGVISSIRALRGGSVGPFDKTQLAEYSSALGALYGKIVNLSNGKSSLLSEPGNGFKNVIGDIKRELSVLKKEVGSVYSGASKATANRNKEAEKAIQNFEKAESKAAEYYRTRKQRVDDAINSLSKKQATLNTLAEKASAEDASMLRSAARQAEILIQRLAGAKQQYEEMQRLKGQGVFGAALSDTYLGRYTGMSELFGANFSKLDRSGLADQLSKFAGGGTMSYNDVLEKYKDIVALASKHISEQEKLNAQADVFSANIGKAKLKMLEIEQLQTRMQNLEHNSGVRSLMGRLTKSPELKDLVAIKNEMRRAVYGGNNMDNLDAVFDRLTLAMKRANGVIADFRQANRQAASDTRELNEEFRKQDQASKAIDRAKDRIDKMVSSLRQLWYKSFDAGGDKFDRACLSDYQTRLIEIKNSFDSLRKSGVVDIDALNEKLRELQSTLTRARIAANETRADLTTDTATQKAAERALQRQKEMLEQIRALYVKWGIRSDYAKSETGRTLANHQAASLSALGDKLRNITISNPKSSSEVQKLVDELNAAKVAIKEASSMFQIFTAQEKEAAAAAQTLRGEQARVRDAVKETTAAAQSLASAFDRVHGSTSGTSRVIQEMKSLFLQGGIVYSAQSLASSIVQQGGAIEQQHIALRAMIGDAQEADNLFGKVKQLAINSPFTFSEMVRDTKMMAAYGIAEKDVYETTKRLGDIAAGLGVSVERLALAFGQVKARSWLDAKELRQFAYAGLPLLSKLSAFYTNKEGKTVTPGDVTKRIKKRGVSFEDVRSVLWELTDADGQFFDMQNTLTDTLLGKYNKLKDAWDITMESFTSSGNIVGNTFKVVLDVVADLIQNIDKLTPLVMGLGSAFGGKALLGFLGNKVGAGGIINDMRKAEVIARNEYAIRQMTRVAEGEISAKRAQQLIAERAQLVASAELKNMKYSQMLAEGKLSLFQLGHLSASKQISVSLVGQLVTTGQLTRQQALLVLQAQRYAGTWRGIWAQTRLAASGLWGSAKGLFSKGNLMIAAIGVVLSAAMNAEQKAGEMRDKAKSASDKYNDKAAKVNEALKKTSGKASEQNVKAMKESLAAAGQLTDEIQRQVNKAKTLAEKYAILRDRMIAVKTASITAGQSQIISNALQRSGGDAFAEAGEGKIAHAYAALSNAVVSVSRFFEMRPEYITDNITKINKLQAAITNMEASLRGSFADIDGAFRKVTAAAGDSVLYKEVSKLPFEQQIERILASQYSDRFIKELKKTNSGAASTARKLRGLVEKGADRLRQVTDKNVPYIVQAIKVGLGLLGIDVKKWSNDQVTTFIVMFNHIMKSAGEMSSYVRSKVYQAFLSSSGLGSVLNPSGLRVLTLIDKKGKKVKDVYVGDEGDDKKGHYIVTGFYKGKDGRNHIRKEYDLSADKPKPDTPTGVNEDDKKKKNSNKAHAAALKADNQTIKALEARLKLIEDAYSMYKKYYEKLHDEKAAAAIVSDAFKGKGLSNDDITKIETEQGYRSLIDDFIKRVQDTKFKLPKEMQDRKDELIASGVSKEKDIDYRVMTEGMDTFSSGADKVVSEMTRTYNAFKTLYAATGNAGLSASVSGLDKDGLSRTGFGVSLGAQTGFAAQFSDYLKNYLDSILLTSRNPLATIDYGAVAKMSNKEIEKYVGGMLAGTDNEKIPMFITYLEKIRDLVTDTEYQEGMNAYAELMKKVVISAAAASRENADYTLLMQKLGARYQAGDLSKEQFDVAKKTATVSHATRLLEVSDEYEQFMNNVTSLTRTAAQRIATSIKNNLNAQLKAGTISAKKYADGIKQVNEKLNQLSSKKSNFASFMQGGLSGLFENMQNTGYSMLELGAQKIQQSNAAFSSWKQTGNQSDLQSGMALSQAGSSMMSKGGSMSAKGGQGANAVAIVDAIVNGINNNVQSFQKLSNDLKETFGGKIQDSKFGDFASGFSAASQGAADGWNSLKNGDMVGAADGVLRSFTGWFDAFNGSANRRYKKQEEYYKNFLSVLNDISSSLEQRVSSDYGSQSIATSRKLAATYSATTSEARKTYSDWASARTIHKNHRNRMYLFDDDDIGVSKQYLSQVNSYLRKIGYTGSAVDFDTIQNLSGDYLKSIKENLPEVWARMNDEARDYLNTIIKSDEATGDLKTATDKLGEVLTGMTFSSVRQEWASLLNDLTSDNDNFADSFEKTMRNAILSSMVTNLYKDKIEAAISELSKAGQNAEYTDKNGNVKKHYLVDENGNFTYAEGDIASEYTKAEYAAGASKMQQISEEATKVRDMLSSLYGWSDSSSSSMSSSIKGMTEQTGDLIASYLNAIRADVSVTRQLQGIYLPKLDITATAQLQQLDSIAQNTSRNALAAEGMLEAVGEMRDLLNSTTRDGSKKIHVAVE